MFVTTTQFCYAKMHTTLHCSYKLNWNLTLPNWEIYLKFKEILT